MIDYFEDFAPYYGAFFTYLSDLPFWTHAAERYAGGSPLLYVGPGAGRLMVELLTRFEVIGVERSPAMFREVTRALALASTAKVLKPHRLIQSDVRNLRENLNVNLLLMPCNVLSENHTEGDMCEILQACSLMLAPHGCIALEVDHIDAYPVGRTLTVEKPVSIPNLFSGRRRTWIERMPDEPRLRLEIELIDEHERCAGRGVRFEHGAFNERTLRSLLERHGYQIIDLYGDAKRLRAVDSDSSSLFAVARRDGGVHAA